MSNKTSSINSSSSSSSRGSAERSESNDGNKVERKSEGSSQTSGSKSGSSSQSHSRSSKDSKSSSRIEESKLNINLKVDAGQNQMSICILQLNHQKEQEDTGKKDTEKEDTENKRKAKTYDHKNKQISIIETYSYDIKSQNIYSNPDLKLNQIENSKRRSLSQCSNHFNFDDLNSEHHGISIKRGTSQTISYEWISFDKFANKMKHKGRVVSSETSSVKKEFVSQDGDDRKVNAGGYMSSSSANSVETMYLFNDSNWNKSNTNYSESIEEEDEHKENVSDKEYKTRKYIKQKNTQTDEKPEGKSKKKIPFTYKPNKKFKEDSLQPQNLRGEIEQKMTVEKASKIDKMSYTFGMEDKLIRNNFENLDTNAANQAINPDLIQIEQHLNELDFGKRVETIDAYSRVVAKFQKCMLNLYFKRSHIKIDSKNKPNKDEQVIIDFVYIYSQILPSMYFYQIKNLPCLQGFDVISLLVTDFKYLGIAFSDLPIVYQTVFERIEISLVWYDDKLKLKLEEFYCSNMKLLQLNSKYLKLNILPVSLLESEDFKNVVENSDKIRVLVECGGFELKNKEEIILERPFPLKELFEIENGMINMMDFSLELIKESQVIHDNNTNSSNNEKVSIDPLKEDIEKCNKVLKDYTGFTLKYARDGTPSCPLNLLDCLYQKQFLKTEIVDCSK